LTPDGMGVGVDAVVFTANKLSGSLALSTADLTAVLVGNVDAFALEASVPRWLAVARYALGEEDWESADTWVTMCYDAGNEALIADRNMSRAIQMPFDATKNYIIATRKSGGTITGWLKPFGESISMASGGTDVAGLHIDTLLVGGNNEPQDLTGCIAHFGLWDRALSDAEVEAAIGY